MLGHKQFFFPKVNLAGKYEKKNPTLPETNIAPENGWLEY